MQNSLPSGSASVIQSARLARTRAPSPARRSASAASRSRCTRFPDGPGLGHANGSSKRRGRAARSVTSCRNDNFKAATAGDAAAACARQRRLLRADRLGLQRCRDRATRSVPGAPGRLRSHALRAAANGLDRGDAAKLMLGQETAKLGVLAAERCSDVCHISDISLPFWSGVHDLSTQNSLPSGSGGIADAPQPREFRVVAGRDLITVQGSRPEPGDRRRMPESKITSRIAAMAASRASSATRQDPARQASNSRYDGARWRHGHNRYGRQMPHRRVSGCSYARRGEASRHQVRGVPGAPRRDADRSEAETAALSRLRPLRMGRRHPPGCSCDGGGRAVADPQRMQDPRQDPRRIVGGDRQQVKEGRAGGLCCTCNQMLPLAGRCDNCAD